MSNKQFVLFVALVAVLSAGLAWWMQRFELDGLHKEISTYMDKHERFRLWEEQNDSN